MQNQELNASYSINGQPVGKMEFKNLEARLQLPDPRTMSCEELMNGSGQMGIAKNKLTHETFTYRFSTYHTPQGLHTEYDLTAISVDK